MANPLFKNHTKMSSFCDGSVNSPVNRFLFVFSQSSFQINCVQLSGATKHKKPSYARRQAWFDDFTL